MPDTMKDWGPLGKYFDEVRLSRDPTHGLGTYFTLEPKRTYGDGRLLLVKAEFDLRKTKQLNCADVESSYEQDENASSRRYI